MEPWRSGARSDDAPEEKPESVPRDAGGGTYAGDGPVVRQIVEIFRDLMGHVTEISNQRIEAYRGELLEEYPARRERLWEEDGLDFPTCLPEDEDQERVLFAEVESTCRAFAVNHPLTQQVVSQIALYKKAQNQHPTLATPHDKQRAGRVSMGSATRQQQQQQQQLSASGGAGKRSRADLELTSPEIVLRGSTLGTASVSRITLFSPNPKGTPGFHSLCRRFEEFGRKDRAIFSRPLPAAPQTGGGQPVRNRNNIDSEQTPIRVNPRVPLDTPAAVPKTDTNPLPPLPEKKPTIQRPPSILPFGQSPCVPRSGFVMRVVESFERGGTPVPRAETNQIPWKGGSAWRQQQQQPNRSISRPGSAWRTPLRQQTGTATIVHQPAEEEEQQPPQQDPTQPEAEPVSPAVPVQGQEDGDVFQDQPNSQPSTANACMPLLSGTPVPMKRPTVCSPPTARMEEVWQKQPDADVVLDTTDDDIPATAAAAEGEAFVPSKRETIEVTLSASSARLSTDTFGPSANAAPPPAEEEEEEEEATVVTVSQEESVRQVPVVPLLPLGKLPPRRPSESPSQNLQRRPVSFDAAATATQRLVDLGLAPAPVRADKATLILGQPREKASDIDWDRGQVIPVKFRGEEMAFAAMAHDGGSQLPSTTAETSYDDGDVPRGSLATGDTMSQTRKTERLSSVACPEEEGEHDGAATIPAGSQAASSPRSGETEEVYTTQESAVPAEPAPETPVRKSNASLAGREEEDHSDGSNGSDLLVTSARQPSSDRAFGSACENGAPHECIKRLTPRAEVSSSEGRRHRVLKPLGPKDADSQADLSDEEGKSMGWPGRPSKKYASWAKDTSTWHEMVREQLSIDPLSIFGCGVRPVVFEEIFQTPDFQRAARDPAYHDLQARHRVHEVISQEARNKKARKWYQDQKLWGFRDHEGVTHEQVARFRKRIGRLRDVASLVWDTAWTTCDHTCNHDSSLRQPWFQKTGDIMSPCPGSCGESPGGRLTLSRHRFMSPLPMSRARELPGVQEEDEGDENAAEVVQAPEGYFRGIFFTTGPGAGSPPPLAEPSSSQRSMIPSRAPLARSISTNIPSPFTGPASTPRRGGPPLAKSAGLPRRVFRPVPTRNEEPAPVPVGSSSVSLFATKLKGK